ncbi:MAG: type I restriction enzyme HsdR N-terminal domain-containing protein [Hymenobacteraceae bacterium]|nr:type I restriction enzyme HsdR N-terminal domain-containing protein [Hymenobacteraceae bacterium]MDX5397323.1 type I restriction enzyme HsdR N-terminal domain-containing protein [Hymenobacteraceae bacterium]MDX5443340.1 type I restriction enzyme HsdR N-terminal domain-containing protein [Hymenobacteraceae bacterium]MDX5513401.1 type I restriction enzyme HsdR N-terminal domain-containing protein [Hymenobacteraceae bacterium]
MQHLNLPAYTYKLQQNGQKQLIFDPFRKKFVALTPEEWVRQHFLHYLINHLHYPKGLISVERATSYNNLYKRTDLCVFDQNGNPGILVECKAASVPVTQEVVKQVSTYNQTIKAPVLVITNGLDHYCWKVDFKLKKFYPLQQIPSFQQFQDLINEK